MKLNRPLEDILDLIEGSVYFLSYQKRGVDQLGQPQYDYGVRCWRAESRTPRRETAEGNSPRQALTALLDKLDMI
jgi:hypothetical protein